MRSALVGKLELLLNVLKWTVWLLHFYVILLQLSHLLEMLLRRLENSNLATLLLWSRFLCALLEKIDCSSTMFYIELVTQVDLLEIKGIALSLSHHSLVTSIASF